MGMAASQARYLGLTARKTNVEYEGQQVNQARTALANQSANLFNQLLTLQVPTPPSSADFTVTQYSYTAGTTDETIESMTPDNSTPGYNYKVTHYHYADQYMGQMLRAANPQVSYDTVADKYYIATNETIPYVSGLDENLDAAFKQINTDQENALQDEIDAGGKVYYYLSVTDGRTYFATKTGLDKCVASSTSTENQDPLNKYYAENSKQKVEKTDLAMVEIGTDGRAKSIKFKDDSQVYPLNAETITDELAYKDAMNQYNYDMASYEKQIQDINAKTEAIQVEDRTLELRLRQLDTEQEALQTEMEAVKKVIDKNIESTFKTFE